MKRVAHLSTEAPVSHSWAEILFPWLYRSDFTYTRVTDFLFCFVFLVELTPNKKVKKPLVVFIAAKILLLKNTSLLLATY